MGQSWQLLVLLGIIGWIAYLIGRNAEAKRQSESLRTTRVEDIKAFEYYLSQAIVQGRLERTNATAVLDLLAEDLRLVQPQTLPSSLPTQPNAPPRFIWPPANEAATEEMAQAVPPPPRFVRPPSVDAPSLASAIQPSIDLPSLASTIQPSPVPVPAGPSLFERLAQGALALRTRQTLLFLGAFLLVASSLILVIFNWQSFPPLLQFALLASVCGGLWGAGSWLVRQPEMTQAGHGVQAVGGVLVPIVIFSLSRPDLLDLAPRQGWLMASLVSSGIYILASIRLRHVLWSVAGTLAALSSVLAATSLINSRWSGITVALGLLLGLPLIYRLRRRTPELGTGSYWVIQTAMPVTLLAASAWTAFGVPAWGLLSITLWLGAAFYAVASLHEQRATPIWLAATLAPAALITTSLASFGQNLGWIALGLAGLALAYLVIHEWLDRPRLTIVLRQVAGWLLPLALATTFFDVRAVGVALPHTLSLWTSLLAYLLTAKLHHRIANLFAAQVNSGLTAALLPLAVLSSLELIAFPSRWMPAVCVLLAAGALPLVRRLTAKRAELAPAAMSSIHLWAGLTLLLARQFGLEPLAATLWLGLGLYLVAFGLARRRLWSLFGAVCAAGAVLISLLVVTVPIEILPFAGVLIGLAYTALGAWLAGRNQPRAAFGPQLMGNLSLVLAAFWGTNLLYLADRVWLLWASSAAFALAAWIQARERPASTAMTERVASTAMTWGAAITTPWALFTSMAVLAINGAWISCGLLGLALLYLAIGWLLEPDHLHFAFPFQLGVFALAVFSFGWFMPESLQSLRIQLPLLIGLLGATVAATHHQRLDWLPTRFRQLLAAASLGLAALALALWIFALITLPFGSELGLLAVIALLNGYWWAAQGWPGQLRPAYQAVLRMAGCVVGLAIGSALLVASTDLSTFSMLLLTITWGMQALLVRRWWWASLAVGTSMIIPFMLLAEFMNSGAWLWGTMTLLAVSYSIGGTALRHTRWRYWTGPAIVASILQALGNLVLIFLAFALGEFTAPNHVASLANFVPVGSLVVLALLASGQALAWCRAWLGYGAVLLAIAATRLAVKTALNTDPNEQIYAWVYDASMLALVPILIGIGELIRNIRKLHTMIAPSRPRFFARPYEQSAFLLAFGTTLMSFEGTILPIVGWVMLTALLIFAVLRYRIRLALLGALFTADIAILYAARLSSATPTIIASVLLVTTWAQALLGLWLHRREQHAAAVPTSASAGFWQQFDRMPLFTGSYLVAALSGVLSMLYASEQLALLAAISLALAALLALLASSEQHKPLTYGALGLLAISLITLHLDRALAANWSIALHLAEALAVYLLGWAMQRFERLAIWRRSLIIGPFLSSGVLIASLIGLTFNAQYLPPVTLGLIILALLCTSAAVRHQHIMLGYVASGVLIAAGLTQFSNWGLVALPWYVIPAGLYLLALADGMRRFQQQHRISQVIETGAIMLLLGIPLAQAIASTGTQAVWITALLCTASLLVLIYGVLAKLRVPFFGGVGFFVAGVIWLSIDPVQAANKWILLGLLGLLMVGVYVLLERQQERLARLGRAFALQLRTWQ